MDGTFTKSRFIVEVVSSDPAIHLELFRMSQHAAKRPAVLSTNVLRVPPVVLKTTKVENAPAKGVVLDWNAYGFNEYTIPSFEPLKT
jgi:hypothetical protein